MNPVHATPFHARTAAANPRNAWTARNGFTLATEYSGMQEEALGARLHVAIADISWRWRVMLQGPRAVECLGRLVTRDVSTLEPGNALKALWLSDDGGVRGAGVIARYGRESFLLAAAATDAVWIANAAGLFGVSKRDVSHEQGGLAIVGPYARKTLVAAGLDADIEPLQLRKLFWRGLDITLSRWGELNGYELWCEADDGVVVWDRLMRAGLPFAIRPAGLAATDVLDVETGIARPGRDYLAAAESGAPLPSAAALRLDRLIDEAKIAFNGRKGWLATRADAPRILSGLEFDGDTPASHAPVTSAGQIVGHTLTSVYSPALRRAIALAMIDARHTAMGTTLSVTLPTTIEAPIPRTATARVAELPFLAPPDPMPE